MAAATRTSKQDSREPIRRMCMTSKFRSQRSLRQRAWSKPDCAPVKTIRSFSTAGQAIRNLE